VRRERRLVSVLGGDRDLPVPGASVQCREHRGVAERVQPVVHPRDLIDILDRALVQPAAVHAKPEVATGLGHEDLRERPLGVRGLCDSQVERFLDLLLDFNATVWSRPVWSRVHGLGFWLELDVVRGGLELT